MDTTPAQPDLAPLEINLFGPPHVRVGGQPLPPLHSRKGYYLLALLTLRHGLSVERAWLAGTLWPDSAEEQALFNLRQCLSNLRQALGAQAGRFLAPTAQMLALDLTAASVDVLDFDAALERGDAASLQEAVALYRGPLLEGCTEEWALPERQRREQAYLNALETLAQHALHAGQPEKAAGHLRAVIALDPLRESAQRGLLQALAQSGDFAAVVLAYRDLRLLLRRELNADPDPQTTTLYRQMRQQARLDAQTLPSERPSAAASTASAASPPGSEDLLEPEVSTLTLTLLFTDIVGSTRLWEEQPGPMRQALLGHDALLRQVIEAHHGEVFKTVGDAFCAVFTTAGEALAAALAAQRALGKIGNQETRQLGNSPDPPFPNVPVSHFPPLQVRMALHSGAVEAREGDYFGPSVNRVARLLALGHGGQILLSGVTCELLGERLPPGVHLQELGRHRLKGVEQPLLVFQLLHPDLPQEFPSLRSPDTLPNNLPEQLSSFIGRELEIQEVQQLLARSKLLSLTGAGGCGKTRLALQVAGQVLEEYPEGVWLVELDALSDPSLVPQAVASALGLREESGRSLSQTLVEYLQSRKVLLLLDNCEHLLLACAQLVEALLKACPPIKVLATSREALRLAGEQVYRVPSLLTPDPAHLTTEEKELAVIVSEYDAARLFVERASLHKPDFALTNQNARVVASICHCLDGIPLGLELAAARVRALSLEQIVSRLEDRFRLLTGGSRTALLRQQTLRATLDWSYDLLSEQERLLLRRLSVFTGGWTLEAAEQISAGKGVEDRAVLDLLSSLVDKSLVVFEEREIGARYRLLETIRQYGRERLAEAGEFEALRRRHGVWFLHLAEEVAPKLRGLEQAALLEQLGVEHDNLRAALEGYQASAQDGLLQLRLAAALEDFWYLRGHLAEGRRWLAAALSREGTVSSTSVRAQALGGAGGLARTQGDLATARALFKEALTVYRELEDQKGIARILMDLGSTAYEVSDFADARTLWEESLSISLQINDHSGIAHAHHLLGIHAMSQNDPAAARIRQEASLVIYRDLGDRIGIAEVLHSLARIARRQGDLAQARALAEESLAIRREMGLRVKIAESLHDLSVTLLDQGDLAAARALSEESLGMFRELGDRWGRAETLHQQGCMAALQGDFQRALALYKESLLFRLDLGHQKGILDSLEEMAEIVSPLHAIRLLGTCQSLRERIDLPLHGDQQEERQAELVKLSTALGEEAFVVAWAEGRAMSMEQAIEYALQHQDP